MAERKRRHRPTDTSEEAVRAAAGTPTLASMTHELQRSHGNAAVARMIEARQADTRTLARNGPDGGVPPVAGVERPAHIDVVPPRPGDAEDMDRAIREHFSNEEWADAARILNDFSQQDIDTRVRGYDVSQRAYLADSASVNGAAANRVRNVAQYENALEFSQWEEAAIAIDGFADPTRVQPRLAGTGAYAVAWILMHAERGNRSVAATAARSVATSRTGDMAAAFEHAVATSDWGGAAVSLNALPDADINPRLASPPRTAAQLFDIDNRAVYWDIARVHAVLTLEPAAGMIAIEGLDRDLRRQIAAAEWPAVTSTLERYNTDDERRARLQWFHLAEVTALADSMRGGAVGVASSPVYPLVEARRVEKLGQDYTAAVNSSNWAVVVTLLNAYNDTDLLPRATEIQTSKGAAGITACQAVAAGFYNDDNHRVRRILAYVPLQGQTGPAPTGGSMTLGPAAGPGVAVAGGTVNAYTNASSGASTGWFGMDYQGPNATSVNWIQFIAREGEKFDASGTSLGFADETWTPSGQTAERRYSTPTNQRWFVDTLGGAAPFYDSPSTVAMDGNAVGSRGAHVTSAGGTGMFDAPGLHASVGSDLFDTWFWEDDVDHVIMRAKFHQYLVQGNQVLLESSMTVSWRMTSASSTPAPVNTAGPSGTTDRMQNVHFRALLARFPAWAFYNHE